MTIFGEAKTLPEKRLVNQSLGGRDMQPELSDFDVNIYPDCVVFKNKNTTLGMTHFSKNDCTLNYIFVHPFFRRKGLGRQLLRKSEEVCGAKLVPVDPLSPSGQKFFQAADRVVSRRV
ncbi:MAG: GNAT family N-acetyltransferase [Rhodospirillaceae bacterium]